MFSIKIHDPFFLKKFLEDMIPFCGATDSPVLDFWWLLPWVSNLGWIPHLCASLPVHNRFLRFTSGATPADLLAASMAASCVPYMHICSRGRMLEFDRETSCTISRCAIHSATATRFKSTILTWLSYRIDTLQFWSLICILKFLFLWTIDIIGKHTEKRK